MSNTPGPWQWMRDGAGRFMLATPHRGRLIVMDFVRMGMNGAQPRFATWKGDEREHLGGIMRPASELVLAEHPDARLIEAAPEMLARLTDAERLMVAYGDPFDGDDWQTVQDIRAVLAKVKGPTP